MSKHSGEAFVIKGLGGTRRLSGSIIVSGSKNAALPMLASSFLFTYPVRFENVPNIEDIDRSKELLEYLGATVEETGKHTVVVNTKDAHGTTLDAAISARFRASIMFTGPILARYGRVAFPHPGGCVIGERPIDIFLEGFKKMGAAVQKRADQYVVTLQKKKLRGADIFLKLPSVGATETFMMAAVLASGTTTIRNAALEPEITCLAEFLASHGAKIEGIGSPTLVIHGTGMLKKQRVVGKVIPDRLEAGSYLILGALCARELTVRKCNPLHLQAVLHAFSRLGVIYEVRGSSITVTGMSKKSVHVTIKTHEYPGFPTDLQAPLAVLCTQVHGAVLLFETIFEDRFQYMHDLVRMGARARLWDAHRATVYGPRKLRARLLTSPDIRAGLAFVVAAATAKGTSTIHNVHLIDRGYEDIDTKLQSIGLSIERIKQ